MNKERKEGATLQSVLRNGDIISQQQFTQLILDLEGIDSLTLLTMAYIPPKGDGGSVVKIHNHLLRLANQGTSIHVGIDYKYAHLIVPHTDFPNKLAPFFMDRRDIKVEELRRSALYEELVSHPNVEVAFHGKGEYRLWPYSKFDHRKILRVKGSTIQDFGIIYGFNMDKTLDHDVDSGIYITDSKALEWMDQQQIKKQRSRPERVIFEDFAFTTRETMRNGERLADQLISEVIQGAEHDLLFCGQFIPDGSVINDLINSSHRGVKVIIVSNGSFPSRQPLYIPTRMFAERKLAKACRENANMQFYVPKDPDTFIHMKALIADMDNSSRTRAITGTDNMANQLLKRLKTREIAVEILNHNYINNLYAFIRSHVLSGVRRVEF